MSNVVSRPAIDSEAISVLLSCVMTIPFGQREIAGDLAGGDERDDPGVGLGAGDELEAEAV